MCVCGCGCGCVCAATGVCTCVTQVPVYRGCPYRFSARERRRDECCYTPYAPLRHFPPSSVLPVSLTPTGNPPRPPLATKRFNFCCGTRCLCVCVRVCVWHTCAHLCDTGACVQSLSTPVAHTFPPLCRASPTGYRHAVHPRSNTTHTHTHTHTHTQDGFATSHSTLISTCLSCSVCLSLTHTHTQVYITLSLPPGSRFVLP